MRATTIITTLLIAAMLIPAAASAATPAQADRQITACFRHAGVVGVVNLPNHGGKAVFHRHPDRWASWQVFEVERGQVVSLLTTDIGLTHRQKRWANRCLRPYGGSV